MFYIGFDRIVSANSSGIRVFWLVVIAAAWGLCISFFYNISVEVFVEKKIFQSSKDVLEKKVLLPDVTICAANPFQGYMASEERQNKRK